MIETATILIAAHFVGDFPLQPSWIATQKQQARILLLHIGLVLFAVVVFLGQLHWPILGITAISHLLLDVGKVRLPRGRCWSHHGLFAIDQGLHIAVALILAMVFPSAASEGYWVSRLSSDGTHWYMAGLTAISGLTLCVSVGGAFIGLITDRLRDQINPARQASHERPQDNRQEGLKNGGTYIGWLERALVFLLVMIQQPAGIGFLIAAKSILRFGDIQEAHQRRLTEYVIIGTLLSFGWAIFFSAITFAIVKLWE